MRRITTDALQQEKEQANKEIEKTCEKFEHKPRVVATGEVFKVFFAVSRTFGAVFSRSRRRKEQKKFSDQSHNKMYQHQIQVKLENVLSGYTIDIYPL